MGCETHLLAVQWAKSVKRKWDQTCFQNETFWGGDVPVPIPAFGRLKQRDSTFKVSETLSQKHKLKDILYKSMIKTSSLHVLPRHLQAHPESRREGTNFPGGRKGATRIKGCLTNISTQRKGTTRPPLLCTRSLHSVTSLFQALRPAPRSSVHCRSLPMV